MKFTPSVEYSISNQDCPSVIASQERVMLFDIIHDALKFVGTSGGTSGIVLTTLE